MKAGGKLGVKGLDTSLRQWQVWWECLRARMKGRHIQRVRGLDLRFYKGASWRGVISGVWQGEWRVREGGSRGSGGPRTGQWECGE